TPEDLDAARFERLADQGQACLPGEPALAAERLREALALWRGHVLEGLEFESSARHDVERLGEERLAVLEQRIQADLSLGHHADVVPELRRLLAVHPYRERLCGQLMVALYRCGR